MDRRRLRAQASIEFVLALTVTLLFLGMIIRLFVWFCGNVVHRQEAFESTRAVSGTSAPQQDFYSQPKLTDGQLNIKK